MPESSPDTEPFRTLPLDRESERAVRALRLTAAVVVLGGAVWLALVAGDPKLWVCSGAAFVASAVWLVMGLRAGRRIRDAERHRLDLDPHALRLLEGGVERRVPWGDVRHIEVDEERLVVRISIADGEPVVLEPRYGGLGVHDLEAAVRRARDEAVAAPIDPAIEVGSGPLQTAST